MWVNTKIPLAYHDKKQAPQGLFQFEAQGLAIT